MTSAPLPDGRSRASEEKAAARVAALFERHGRMVYGVNRAMLRHVQDAEDATQQTFLAAHRALLAGARVRDEGSWLATIARNECRARIAAGMRTPPALADEDLDALPATHDELERSARAEALRTAIAELPERQREAVVLRDLYGLHYGEVATALGLSRPATEALLFRARRSLRVKLRPAVGVVLAVPVAIRDDLAEAIPGFGASAGSGVAVAGTAGGVLAKLTAGPLGFKVATAAVAVSAVGAVGTVGPDPAVRDRVVRTPISESVDARSNVSADRTDVAAEVPGSGHSDRSPRSSGHGGEDHPGHQDSGRSGDAPGSDGTSGLQGQGPGGPSGGSASGDDGRGGGDGSAGSGSDGSGDPGGTRTQGPTPTGTSGPTSDDGGTSGDTGGSGSGSSGPGPGMEPGSSGSNSSGASLDDRSSGGSRDGGASLSGSPGSGGGSPGGSSGGSDGSGGGGSESGTSGSGGSDDGSGSGSH